MSVMASPSSHVPQPSDSEVSQEVEPSSTGQWKIDPALVPPHLCKPWQTYARRKLIVDTATDKVAGVNNPAEEDASARVFSPMNSQMLSDIIGFTSSFSEAMVSPRKQCASPADRYLGVDRYSPSCHVLKATNIGAGQMSTVATAMDISSKQGATRMSEEFSDFAGFAPTSFDSDNKETMASDAKSGIADRVQFFVSPFTTTSDADASNAFPDSNNNFMDASKININHFETDWVPSATVVNGDTNPAKENDESEEMLSSQLDEILDIKTSETPRDVQACHTPPSWSSLHLEENANPPMLNTMHVETSNEEGCNDVKDDLRAKNSIFFGSPFNGSNDTGVDQIRVRENIIASSRDQLDEKLSTIDEADEDFAAMSKMFKEQLDDELRELFSRIWMKFDKKVNDLEKKVRGSTVENSVIKDEMCHQHLQIQKLMVQLESTQDMLQANQCLMKEIEDLRAQLQVNEAEHKNKWGRGIIMYRKKTSNKMSRLI